MKAKDLAPFTIHRNAVFFAKVQWMLYKAFGIRRKNPCGRTKRDSFLCCCQPKFDSEYCYLNKDGTEAYCKCCGSIRMRSSRKIDLDSPEWMEI